MLKTMLSWMLPFDLPVVLAGGGDQPFTEQTLTEELPPSAQQGVGRLQDLAGWELLSTAADLRQGIRFYQQ